MNTSYLSKTIVWKAEKYNKLATGQLSAATQLIQKLKIPTKSHILDVGCGDGKITAELAIKAKDGLVLGIDASNEMIEFAKKKYGNKISASNLSFCLQKAESLSVDQEFDIIFSSFALQWVSDKNKFFSHAYNHLKSEGTLALLMPLETSLELKQAIDSVTSQAEWKSYFEGFAPNWHFESKSIIEYLVNQNSFSISQSTYTIQDVHFSSKSSLESYIMLWFPYLDPLPEFLKEPFFQQIMDTYYALMSSHCEINEFVIKIPQLELIAQKAI